MAWETSQSSEPRIERPDEILARATANTFMSRVYRWMVAGLSLTAFVAMAVASSPDLFLLARQLYLPLILAELGIVLAFSFLASRVSGPVAAVLFLLYSALNGVTFSMLFAVYALGSLAQVFFVTALMYGALAFYGTVTKKDLSVWRTFLFMGLIGVVAAGFINIFVHSSGLSFISSCAAVVVFAGLTAYDHQKLRALHASSGYSSAASLAINGALILYLDFINLFLALLRLFGRRR